MGQRVFEDIYQSWNETILKSKCFMSLLLYMYVWLSRYIVIIGMRAFLCSNQNWISNIWKSNCASHFYWYNKYTIQISVHFVENVSLFIHDDIFIYNGGKLAVSPGTIWKEVALNVGIQFRWRRHLNLFD